MSIGPSGRIVIEIDPVRKREVYAHLALRGVTLKDWFVGQVDQLLKDEAPTRPSQGMNAQTPRASEEESS